MKKIIFEVMGGECEVIAKGYETVANYQTGELEEMLKLTLMPYNSGGWGIEKSVNKEELKIEELDQEFAESFAKEAYPKLIFNAA